MYSYRRIVKEIDRVYIYIYANQTFLFFFLTYRVDNRHTKLKITFGNACLKNKQGTESQQRERKRKKKETKQFITIPPTPLPLSAADEVIGTA
jgi:hypothetical protein